MFLPTLPVPKCVDLKMSGLLPVPYIPNTLFIEDFDMQRKGVRIKWQQQKSAVIFVVVGCFGFNGLFRQYFSLYRAVSQREGEREEKR